MYSKSAQFVQDWSKKSIIILVKKASKYSKFVQSRAEFVQKGLNLFKIGQKDLKISNFQNCPGKNVTYTFFLANFGLAQCVQCYFAWAKFKL